MANPVAIQRAFQATTLPTPVLACRSDHLVRGCGSHTGSGSVIVKGWRRGWRRGDVARRSRVHGDSEANTWKVRGSRVGLLDRPSNRGCLVLLRDPHRGLGDLVNRRVYGGIYRRVVAELLLRDTDDLHAVCAARVSHQALQQPQGASAILSLHHRCSCRPRGGGKPFLRGG